MNIGIGIGIPQQQLLAAGTTSYVEATGGTVTTDGDYKVHTFNTSGNFEVLSGSGDIEYLLVGGGGAGGWVLGGGGGAGELISDIESITVGVFPVIIGAGGAGVADGSGGNGSNSTFNGHTALGGGGGGTANKDGKNGGSGGGAGGNLAMIGGTSIAVEGVGHNGGYTSFGAGAGGGGAATQGIDNNSSGANTPTLGGDGLSINITGAAVEYAKGGQGGGLSSGQGGAGVANRGDGGSGCIVTETSGFAGGSGVCIIRYKFQ